MAEEQKNISIQFNTPDKTAEYVQKNPNTADGTTPSINIQIPFLTIKAIPNLQIDNVDIDFDMEVKEFDKSK